MKSKSSNGLPYGWELVEFQEIAEFLRGPFGSSIKKSVCVSKGLATYKLYEQGNVIQNDFRRGTYYITKEKFDELRKFEILPGDILITCAGTLGKIAIVPEGIERGIINSVLMRIRLNNSKILTKYFLYFFQSPEVQMRIFSKSIGATIKNLFATKNLRMFKIPLPPLKIQKKIVAVLDKTDRLKEMRENANRETNKILQLIFFEMFGDPLSNDKNWEKMDLKEASLEIQPGFAFGGFNKSKGIPHIRPFNISEDGDLVFNEIKFVPKEAIKNKRYVLNEGDILFNSTNSEELVGKTTIFNLKSVYTFSNHITKIRLKTDIINPYYFLCTFYIFYKFGVFKTMMKRWVNQVGIDTRKLESLKIPIPPIKLQNQFAIRFQKIESMKYKQQKSTENIDQLFGALKQKAFNGELVEVLY